MLWRYFGEVSLFFFFSLGVTVSLDLQLVASEWVISHQHVSQVLVLVSSTGDSVTKIISGTSRLAGSVRVGVSWLGFWFVCSWRGRGLQLRGFLVRVMGRASMSYTPPHCALGIWGAREGLHEAGRWC